MCHNSCSKFVSTVIGQEEIFGKNVIEVGSYNVNGSLRSHIEGYLPKSYVGVDIHAGPGVDRVCSADKLIDHFGDQKLDLLISTEMLEHVRNWRSVISNFKNILAPHGVLVLTTRSRGFNYHGYPFDFWRYELSDMEAIFSDFIIESLELDPEIPGVFIRARKPAQFIENDLSGYHLYSIITGRRAVEFTDRDFALAKIKFGVRQKVLDIIPKSLKYFLKNKIFPNMAD